MGTLMGLHQIDEFLKIRSIYVTRKIINNTTYHPQHYLQWDGHTYLLTHRHIFS